MKIIYFLETIAALGLKLAWSIQLNKFMKLGEYQRSRSFFDLGQRSLRFQSSNLFFSKTGGQFGTKVHMKAWRRIGMKINTNELDHMTKMAAMPIYGKNLKKIFFSRTNWPMTLKLVMYYCVCEYYQDCSNYLPGLTLTYFTPRSNLVT